MRMPCKNEKVWHQWKKHLKYKVNGSQSITIWINLGLKGLWFIWNMSHRITIFNKNLKYFHFTSRVLDWFIALYYFMLFLTHSKLLKLYCTHVMVQSQIYKQWHFWGWQKRKLVIERVMWLYHIFESAYPDC